MFCTWRKKLILSLACVFVGGYAQVTSEESLQQKIKDVDAVIQRALEEFPIPGLAVGVVVDGKIALTKGYGLRDKAKELPVTERTLFAIGSCSKAFTTFALGQLVDEGLIAWDDPVIQHLPEFRLKDLHATHHLSIRDLVSHRSGLPRHDLVWYNSKCSRADLLSKLQHLELTADLREKFQYNNLMYVVAGLLIERVTGGSWEEYVQKHIFEAIGMEGANFSVEESQQAEDAALPYSERNQQIEAIEFRNICNAGPAGAINASAADMAKWVQLQISGGAPLIDPETLSEMHRVQTSLPPMPFCTKDDSTWLFGYGLGWFTGLHKGHYALDHGGGIDGFVSSVVLFPKEKMGVVVLSNFDGQQFVPAALAYAIADCLMGASDEAWLTEVKEWREKYKELQATKKEEDFTEHSLPLHPLDQYVGEYEHPGYGCLQISSEMGHLVALFNDLAYDFEPRGYDHFAGKIRKGFDVSFSLSSYFLSNTAGDISEIHVLLEPSLPPIVFKKKASNELLTADYLKKFEGVFDCAFCAMEISFKKGKLMAALAGQPSYELKPEKVNLFSLNKIPDCSLTFVMGEDGAISELQLCQAGHTLVLHPKRVLAVSASVPETANTL